MDEFITTRPKTSPLLHLIITTRNEQKSTSTITRLKQHLARHPQEAQTRISFQSEGLDLTSLCSVQLLSQKLVHSLPKLDIVFLNAGIGGFKGINWPAAIWGILTNFLDAVTHPSYKLSHIGYTTLPQKTSDSHDPSNGIKKPHPPLAEVFCANVFGHYLLVHQLFPCLSHPSSSARIIWISSIEAYASTFSPTDIQALSAPKPYESSKRLTDILALTSTLPSTRPFVSRLLSHSDYPPPTRPPKMYLAHPGICATAILPLALVLRYALLLAFYLARWIGSPWHTVTAYKGACAPVWLALSPQEELDAIAEAHDARGGEVFGCGGGCKWGSCTDRQGNETVRRTEVEGEGSEGWEELGRSCWMQMEQLREEWDARIGGFD